MKKLFIVLLLIFSMKGFTQSLYFPPTSGNNWDTISAASLGWCANYLDTLDQYLANENTDAFILLKDGKIVFEKYYGTFTADSVHTWNSAGKTMTAFLIGLVQQENLLDISDKTSDYLGNTWTSAPQVKEDLITIKNQLSMTSGLDDSVADVFCTDDTCLHYLADAGTRWAYHNGPYTLLQNVIQSAVGSSSNVYMFQKLNATTGFAASFISVGYNRLLFSKPRMMARFGLLMLNKGNWNGTQILSDTTFYNQMITPSQSINNAYGYLWWLNGQSDFILPGSQIVFPGKLSPNAPDDTYAALGKNDQLLVISPSKNIVFMRMGDSGNSALVGTSMSNDIWGILNQLMCSPSATSNVIKEEPIIIYPNPTKNELHINTKEKVLQSSLYSLSGQMVLKGIDELQLSQLKKGIYFLTVKTAKGVYQKKIIKE